MKIELLQNSRPLFGTISLERDKSISHRAIILASLANGTTRINNLLESEDVFRTINAFKLMGVEIEKKGPVYVIKSKGIRGLKEPKEPLYFGNSGTTARLMIGLLAGLPFNSKVTGDSSLTKRPMDRVILPLKEMGAILSSQGRDMTLPLTIQGRQLHGFEYTIPVKSAQVKSALLFAGLLANSATTVTELAQTRNHTEIMLKEFGSKIITEKHAITIKPTDSLIAGNLFIPGDISSASFWIVGALIVPGSHVRIKDLGLNDTRTGILDVLRKMGANVLLEEITEEAGERTGTLTIKHQPLKATTIEGDLIPRLIDEIPIIALLATQAEGTTIIRGAEELRVKETDRIKAIVTVLSTLGATIKPTEDGMIIKGKTSLTGGDVSSYDDHRIAMMIVIASLITNQKVNIDELSSISISYPRFFKDLKQLTE